MADIRFKDLTTQVSETSSDDFFAVDGATNGTRKFSAFSPTFGGAVHATGNLTTDGNFQCYQHGYIEGNLQVQANVFSVSGLATEGEVQADICYKLLTYSVVPTTDANYASIYIDPADGDLKIKFTNGVVKTIATN